MQKATNIVGFALQKDPGDGTVPQGLDPPAVAAEASTTAVADDQPSTAVADEAGGSPSGDESSSSGADDGYSSSGFGSVVGDSVADSSEGDDTDPTAVAARRQARRAPPEPIHGEIPEGRGTPAWRNSQPEVGNMGIDSGNLWGIAPLPQMEHNEKIKRRYRHDKQIVISPAQIIVLCEANKEVEEALKRPGVPGAASPREAAVADTSEDDKPPQSRVQRRATYENWVVRGNAVATVIIAARNGTCTYLEKLDFEVHDDHTYNEKTN